MRVRVEGVAKVQRKLEFLEIERRRHVGHPVARQLVVRQGGTAIEPGASIAHVALMRAEGGAMACKSERIAPPESRRKTSTVRQASAGVSEPQRVLGQLGIDGREVAVQGQLRGRAPRGAQLEALDPRFAGIHDHTHAVDSGQLLDIVPLDVVDR